MQVSINFEGNNVDADVLGSYKQSLSMQTGDSATIIKTDYSDDGHNEMISMKC